MTARFRSWRQKIKQHWVAIGVAAIVFIVVVVFTLIFAVVQSNGTGFNGYNKVTTVHTISGPSSGTVTKTEEYQPGKKLWDWLQLLIIPLVLAIVAYLFNRATSRNEHKITERRYLNDQKIAEKRYLNDQDITADKQKEDLLQTYFDRMSELLLKCQLRTSDPKDEVRYIARSRTLTVLSRLDARRKKSLLQFLHESDLINATTTDSTVELKGADLSGADLSGADLRLAALYSTNLSSADLSSADLSSANLNKANLNKANLSHADLSGASLIDADLSSANLSEAHLKEANPAHANLSGAKLSGAVLNSANLVKAKLSGSDLSGAYLYDAILDGAYLSNTDLSGANLTGAIGTTPEQLAEAKSLKGTTMPDGKIHP